MKHSYKLLLLILLSVPLVASAQSPMWQQLAGPVGGSAQHFTAMPNGDIIATSNRLYRSSDKGQSWTPFSPVNLSSMGYWIGRSLGMNSKGEIFADGDTEFFATTDYGTTWEKRAGWKSFDWQPAENLMIDSKDNLYMIASDSLYRSTDDGFTWVGMTTFPRYNHSPLYAAPSGSIFVGLMTGIAKSTDQGATWTQITIDTNSWEDIRELTGDGSDLYTVCHGVFFHSTDDGATWSAPNSGLPTNHTCFAFGAHGNDLMIAYYPEGVFLSTDKGSNWNLSLPAPDSQGRYVEALLPVDDSNLLMSYENGVYGTADGGKTVSAYQTGMLNTYVSSVTTTSSGEIFAWAWPGGLLATTDLGTSWTLKQGGLDSTNGWPDAGTVSVGAPNELYTGSYRGAFRTSDDGASWTKLSSGIPGVYGMYPYPASDGNLYALASTNGNIMYILWSTDHGTSWSDISGSLSGFLSASYPLQGFAADSNGTLYVGVGNTYHKVGNDIYPNQDATIAISTDKGVTWKQSESLRSILANTHPWECSVEDIQIDLNGNILVAFSNGVAVSTDQGSSWIVSPHIEEVQHIVSNSKGHIFIGTRQSGLFASSDLGQSWVQINGEVPVTSTSSLYIDKNDFLMVGAGASGVFRTVQHTNSIAHQTSTVAPTPSSEFAMTEPYPNPSTGTASIDFTLTGSGYVRATLVDMTGRTVQTPLNEYLGSGPHTATLDLGELPSGIYRVSLTEGDRQQTRYVSVIR